MNLPLFVYGTLMDADMRCAVLGGDLPPSAMHSAVAAGHRVVLYPGRTYPAFTRADGASATGLLLCDLMPAAIVALDRFEGDEYARRPLVIRCGDALREAEAYYPTRIIPANAPPWHFAAWQHDHKPSMLAAETGRD